MATRWPQSTYASSGMAGIGFTKPGWKARTITETINEEEKSYEFNYIRYMKKKKYC